MLRSGSGGLITSFLTGILVAAGIGANADEVYAHRQISELTIVAGQLPAPPEPGHEPWPSGRLQAAGRPYVVLDVPGEAYLRRDFKAEQVGDGAGDHLRTSDIFAFRVSDRREVTGRLFAPRGDRPGLVEVKFKVALPPAQDDAKQVFAMAKVSHYQQLLGFGMPGAAWFAHQIREAEALLPADSDRRAIPGTMASGELDRTLELFSGEQAINENLQLDRPLPERGGANAGQQKDQARPEPKVKIETLAGIAVAEIDWSARLKGKTPALDALARNVPADQHAIFLPSLKAASLLLAEFQGDALPMAALFAPHAQDRGIQKRYEHQLGTALDDLVRFPGVRSIQSLALTGSDPYLPSGTDLAVLVETSNPDELASFLKAQLDAARRAESTAKDASGSVDEVAYVGARTDDRRLSCYVATLDKVVVATNSPVQLARLIKTAQGKTPRLSDQPEYRFFRDRYVRNHAGEAGFLVMTDAAIRRWCGPRWRIGSSRRLRAAAALAELQARHLAPIAEGSARETTLEGPANAIDLGKVRLERHGVRSETFGTVAFQTPIAELALDEVEQHEADAYNRWRDTYQTNWRGVFDPIGLRVTSTADRLGVDLSVIPLIVGSDYRTFVDLAGNSRIAADAGDRHSDTLLHAILALDVQSKLFRQGNDQLAALTRVPQSVALGWVGRSASVYLDIDPFWKELAAAKKVDAFLNTQANRLPLAIQLEVTDGVRLALFLAGLRAFVDQSAPNLTTWQNKEHQGQRYVQVTETERGPANAQGRPRISLSYFASPQSLTLSLNEGVVRHAIERHVARSKAQPAPASAPSSTPWLGQSLALQLSHPGLELLGSSGLAAARYDLLANSWSNLPILNEWKRLCPDRDPVAVHQELWGTTLLDPSGGRYVWNAEWATMESTATGHPGQPKLDAALPGSPFNRFRTANFGITFEDGGLRARAEVEVAGKP